MMPSSRTALRPISTFFHVFIPFRRATVTYCCGSSIRGETQNRPIIACPWHGPKAGGGTGRWVAAKHGFVKALEAVAWRPNLPESGPLLLALMSPMNIELAERSVLRGWPFYAFHRFYQEFAGYIRRRGPGRGGGWVG